MVPIMVLVECSIFLFVAVSVTKLSLVGNYRYVVRNYILSPKKSEMRVVSCRVVSKNNFVRWVNEPAFYTM